MTVTQVDEQTRFVTTMRAILGAAIKQVEKITEDEAAHTAKLGRLIADARWLFDLRTATTTRPQIDAMAPPELD